MKYYFIIVFLLFFFDTTPTYAAKCISVYGSSATNIKINDKIGIVSSLPKGTKLWVGNSVTTTLRCWQESSSMSELIYLYLNPENISSSALGDQIEIGVTIGGEDFICDSGTSGCKKSIDLYLGSCANGSNCVLNAKNTTITFRPFIIKKSESSQNNSDTVTTLSNYHLLAFGDRRGANLDTSAYQFYIENLNNFKNIPCAANISISPQKIDFGHVSVDLYKDQLIKEVPFRITLNKTCESVFAISALMNPINSTIQNNIIIPNDNNTIGIKIYDSSNKNQLLINNEFLLFDYSSQKTQYKNFYAQLNWLKKPYQVGSFNVGVNIDIYYK
ncbi:fimbrial protein [Acinetobacter sp. V89_7]|uniref:fimbrial protein n=1 Tax=Acinetobacter sp. V89_7 TaxID=3044233 RepID=UPI00249F0D08|nr:fimbrial protein [Acinetobacter sp. V89_7]MDI3379615.1 fimbrial protein [Acinetobacter sp. V89_7]